MPERFLLAAAVYSICVRDQQVLLLRRAGSGFRDGELSLPAGHLDGDESVVTAMIRELGEEVGLGAEPEDCRLVLTAHHARESATDHEYVDFYFTVDRWRGDPVIAEPDTCTELVWANLDSLPEDVVDYVRDALAAWRAGLTLLLPGWADRPAGPPDGGDRVIRLTSRDLGGDAGPMSSEFVPERWTRGTVYTDMWVDPDDDPRDTGRLPVGERETVLFYLSSYRHTLRMKCDGLDADQLARRSVPPSTMSLLGLVRHLAEVERSWTRRGMLGEDAARLYCTPENRDGDFDDALADPDLVEQAFTAWETEMAATDAMIASIADLGTLAVRGQPERPALRDILIHLIEEYARHCGHADLLRERIDGRVGQ